MKSKIHISGFVTIIDKNLEHKEKGVNTDDIRGIVLRCIDNDSYYFDSNGIYSKTLRHKEDSRASFIRIEGVDNYNVITKIISGLKLGDPISKIFELAKVTKLESHELPKGTNRFITVNNNSIKIERNPENKNKGSFDRIRINCGLVRSVDSFNELNDEKINNVKTLKGKQKAYIEQNWIEISQMILYNLQTSKKFSKYGIPINFLRMTSCKLNNNSTLEIIFELKQLGQDGQNRIKENNKNNKKVEDDYTQ